MNTIDQWIKDEDLVLFAVQNGRGYGPTNPEDVRDKTGIEIVQGMLNGTMPIASISGAMSFGGISVQPGIAVFQGNPSTNFLNPMGTVHGGWMSTVMDSTMGCAVLSGLPANKSYTTQSLSVIFKKMLTLEVGRVRVIAEVQTDLEKLKTARSALVRAKLVDSKGAVYAVSKARCRIFRTA